jgi:hypothetical protein
MDQYSEADTCAKSVNPVMPSKPDVPLSKTMQLIMDFYKSNNELPIEFIKKTITSSFIFDNSESVSNDIWLDILHKTKAWYYLTDPTAILLLLTQTDKPQLNCVFPFVLIDKMQYIPFQSFISVFGKSKQFSLDHTVIQYLLEIEDIDISFVLKVISTNNKHIKNYNKLLQNSKHINKIIEHIPEKMIDWKILFNNPYLDHTIIIKNISKFNYNQTCSKLKGIELEKYKQNWTQYIFRISNMSESYTSIDIDINVSIGASSEVKAKSIPTLSELTLSSINEKSEQELEIENRTLRLQLQKLTSQF